MCPWHIGRAWLEVIWEDDIWPRLIRLSVIVAFILMGAIAGLMIILFGLILHRFLP